MQLFSTLYTTNTFIFYFHKLGWNDCSKINLFWEKQGGHLNLGRRTEWVETREIGHDHLVYPCCLYWFPCNFLRARGGSASLALLLVRPHIHREAWELDHSVSLIFGPCTAAPEHDRKGYGMHWTALNGEISSGSRGLTGDLHICTSWLKYRGARQAHSTTTKGIYMSRYSIVQVVKLNARNRPRGAGRNRIVWLSSSASARARQSAIAWMNTAASRVPWARGAETKTMLAVERSSGGTFAHVPTAQRADPETIIQWLLSSSAWDI